MTPILLTGATGFVGREILVRFLEQGRPVLAVSRPRKDETEAQAQERLQSMVERTRPGTSVQGLTVAHADVTRENLGLSPAGVQFVADAPSLQVMHGAAEVRFDLPIETMREQNVGGTKNVMAFCQRLQAEGRLHRFDHISTAYVAGDREGTVLETEVDVGQAPRNAYEQTKLESETNVQKASQDGLPVTVHRPSIVVGDSKSGKASSFKVLYWPLKVYAKGRWRTVFGRPDCPVDIVPVDFVADASVALADMPEATGKTVHLTAGPDGQATIDEMAELVRGLLNGPKVRYLDLETYNRWIRWWVHPILVALRPDVARKGGVYLPYLQGNPTFDTSVAQSLLGSCGITAPRVHDYFERIVQFALQSDFGRND